MQKAKISILFVVIASGCISVPPTTTVDAKVTEVVDGDTIMAEWDNQTEEIRFKGIDTPEVNTENTPSDFEGVVNSEAGKQCLRKWGKNASQHVKSEIGNERIKLEFALIPNMRRGTYGRIIGVIKYNETDLNRELVEKGLARSYSDKGPYIEEGRDAKLAMRGVWNCQMVS